MKLFHIAALAVIGSTLFPTIASAGPLQNRLNHQDRRIYNGIQNGSLTYKEAQKLEHRQDQIEAQRLRDIRDGGRLTPFEAFKLNWALNRQSHQIYQQKHD